MGRYHNDKGLWQHLQDISFADSFLEGHENPYDEVEGGKQKIANPTEVFKILDGISERLRAIIDTIEDPWQFYPVLMREGKKIAEGEELPKTVREVVMRMIESIASDISTIYKDRPEDQTPGREDPNHTAQRVMDDMKQTAWVPLDSNEVLDRIAVQSVPINEIEGLSEMIPQLALLTEHSGMKGGAARLALKLLALQKMNPMDEESKEAEILIKSIEAELPLSDMDLVITEEETDPHGFAKKMGVHPVDIEVMRNLSKGSMIDHFGRRDLSSNQALLTKDQLHYTEKALSDLQTNPGLARSIVPTIPGLFGRESFYVNKKLYKAANTLYRLVKMVAEGKNTHFTAPRYNLATIPLGKHWLTMARKWIKRDDRAKVFAAAYSCAKQMGATTTTTPADYFEELLKESPDFTFTDQQTVLDVTKWLAKKYILFLEKILRRKFGLHPERVEEVFANTDETEVTVRPDLSGITEANLTDVEAIFKRIESVEKAPERTSRDSAKKQEFITMIRARREKLIADVKKQMDEMREKGPQVGDTLEPRDRFERPLKIFKIESGIVYLKDWLGDNSTTSIENLEVKYSQGTRTTEPGPTWALKKGAKTERVPHKPPEFDQPPGRFPRNPWDRRGGGWGYGAP